MEIFIAITSILGALLIGAASPGPSFVVVARASIAQSRSNGVAAAFGMGVGGVIYGGLALLGLHIVLAQVEWLYVGLRVLGGAYLLYLGYRIWRGASEPIVVAESAGKTGVGRGKSFAYALTAQLSNPKTAIVYGSIFAALLPPDLSAWVSLIMLPLVLLVETGWYLVVALVFSSRSPRAVYLRSKTWIDRTAGAVMGLLGTTLIVEARRSL